MSVINSIKRNPDFNDPGIREVPTSCFVPFTVNKKDGQESLIYVELSSKNEDVNFVNTTSSEDYIDKTEYDSNTLIEIESLARISISSIQAAFEIPEIWYQNSIKHFDELAKEAEEHVPSILDRPTQPHIPSIAFLNHRNLEKKLRKVRDENIGRESEEEDAILDEMEALWYEMDEVEHSMLVKENF